MSQADGDRLGTFENSPQDVRRGVPTKDNAKRQPVRQRTSEHCFSANGRSAAGVHGAGSPQIQLDPT